MGDNIGSRLRESRLLAPADACSRNLGSAFQANSVYDSFEHPIKIRTSKASMTHLSSLVMYLSYKKTDFFPLAVCYVILKNPSMRTSTNVFLCSLSMADVTLLFLGKRESEN